MGVFKRYYTGDDYIGRFLRIVSLSTALQKYLVPWLAGMIVMVNTMVCIMYCGIYVKTTRKNHKPAFLFIFFLNFVDVLLGMYGTEFTFKGTDLYFLGIVFSTNFSSYFQQIMR